MIQVGADATAISPGKLKRPLFCQICVKNGSECSFKQINTIQFKFFIVFLNDTH